MTITRPFLSTTVTCTPLCDGKAKLADASICIELTPEEKLAAYRECERNFRLKDAERHLACHIFGSEEDVELESSEAVEFEVLYHRSYSDAITPGSEGYILDDIVDKYEDLFDCNTAENDTWGNAVESVLAIAAII